MFNPLSLKFFNSLTMVCFIFVFTLNVQANCNLKGDINDDCQIDIKEAIYALQIASGYIPAPQNTISEHLFNVLIAKGRDYNYPDTQNDDKYGFGMALITDNTVQSISILCPGGKIVEINDYTQYKIGKLWMLEREADSAEGLKQYGDGEFVIKLHYFSEYTEITRINFYDIENSKPFSFFQSVPSFLSPEHGDLLSPDEPVLFYWDKSNIDANVQKIEIECEKGNDVLEKVYDVSKNPPSDPFHLSTGQWKCDITFGYSIQDKNEDNVNFEIQLYSESNYLINIDKKNYQWVDYDNFDDNDLDYSKWELNNQSTNSIPQEINGQLEFNTFFSGNGSSYLDIKQNDLWGIQADISLNSSFHANAGIVIHVEFDDPNLDDAYFYILIFSNNSNYFAELGALVNGTDDFHSWQFNQQDSTSNILYTPFNLGIVFENDKMICFLNNNYFASSHTIPNLSSSIKSIGVGTLTIKADTVVGTIDNVKILK